MVERLGKLAVRQILFLRKVNIVIPFYISCCKDVVLNYG
jgi:hypothetical protein